MSTLPDLPPRQRRAFSAVLLTLGSYPEGQVTASRGELLSRAGKLLDGPEGRPMAWPTWLRGLERALTWRRRRQEGSVSPPG